MAAPMPFDAPVTTATLPVNLFIRLLLLGDDLSTFAFHFDHSRIDERKSRNDSAFFLRCETGTNRSSASKVRQPVHVGIQDVAPQANVREFSVSLHADQPGGFEFSQMVRYRSGSESQPLAHTRASRRFPRCRDPLQHLKPFRIRKSFAD